MSETRTIPFHGRSRTLRESPSSGNQSRLTFLGEVIRRRRDRTSSNHPHNIQLEEIAEIPEDQQERGIRQILNPEVLYRHSEWRRLQGRYTYNREVAMSVLNNQTETINLLSPEGAFRLRERGYNLIHIGLIAIKIRPLHRRETGAKCFVMILDKRFNKAAKANLGAMEIDLNQGAEIIYLVPNTYMSIRDFQKYLCVGIQTRGYEDMTEGDNLLTICYEGD
ncbi:Polyprotein P3 [Nymphaea thermarum]|nr:Polyprotein P3 [Nymphaea thermarum]